MTFYRARRYAIIHHQVDASARRVYEIILFYDILIYFFLTAHSVYDWFIFHRRWSSVVWWTRTQVTHVRSSPPQQIYAITSAIVYTLHSDHSLIHHHWRYRHLYSGVPYNVMSTVNMLSFRVRPGFEVSSNPIHHRRRTYSIPLPDCAHSAYYSRDEDFTHARVWLVFSSETILKIFIYTIRTTTIITIYHCYYNTILYIYYHVFH